MGYYGSILQITGNTTYAKNLASDYLESSLDNIAYMHPDLMPSFQINHSHVATAWFNKTSYSEGSINVTYSLLGLGVENVQYATSIRLEVTVNPSNTTSVLVNITRDGGRHYSTLSVNNFFFYNYSFTDSIWKLNNTGVIVNSISSTEIQSAYNITVPSGVDSSSYMLQVADSRGIMVTAATFSQYTYDLAWNQTLYSAIGDNTMVIEALQNGTLRWLGQKLETTTLIKPIPPISVKAIRINQTINGANREVPFQIEDWGSEYRAPAGLTSNASVFSSRQMLVFLINNNVTNVILWWDGRDISNQTSYAYTNRYFTTDNPSAGILTNGILTLNIANFDITSTVGATTSTAEFMRINGRTPSYGANLAYIIHHGIIRDVIHQEAEWSGGVSGCPNFYSQIVITLPANSTYYTFALRTIFVNSSQARAITDLSLIQLSSELMSGASLSLTENGTIGGKPMVHETLVDSTDLFYNFSSSPTGWAHHWSEYINGNNGSGIILTDKSNKQLYAFDNIAGDKTGALSVTSMQSAVWSTPTAVYDKCGEDSWDPAIDAIDGSTSTYWRHSSTCNHWIEFDMGETMNISKVRIYQHSWDSSRRWGQSSGIEIYVSDDPYNWGSAIWIGTLNSGGWRESGSFSAEGRYVRLYSRSSSSSQRLYEVQVQIQEREITIEFNPVERYQTAFTYPMDLIWFGAVVTFEGEPIYKSSDETGLWVMVEHPPTVTIG